MDLLELYILPGDGVHDPRKAIRSFEGISQKVIIMATRQLDKEILKPYRRTLPWFGYLLSHEWLDDSAREALPVFLNSNSFDCLVMMSPDFNAEGEVVKIRQSPRIFRSNVSLQDNLLVPNNPSQLKFERMLDGWIRHAEI
jgi:hypothetical protein